MTVATLEWAEARSRLLGELTQTVTKELPRSARYEEAVRELVTVLDTLRGSEGRGAVSQLEIEFQEFVDGEEHIQQRRLNYEQMRKRLPTLPAELKEQTASNLAQIETTLREALSVQRELGEELWKHACRSLDIYLQWIAALRAGLPPLPRGRFTQVGWEMVQELENLAERLREILRSATLARLEPLESALPPHLVREVWTVHISPLAYLRAMWNLFWSAIRHPLSETTIDLSTGRVLYRT